MTDEEILALLRRLSVEEKLLLLGVLTSAVKTPQDASSSPAKADESK
jgi:hypothetical protein